MERVSSQHTLRIENEDMQVWTCRLRDLFLTLSIALASVLTGDNLRYRFIYQGSLILFVSFAFLARDYASTKKTISFFGFFFWILTVAWLCMVSLFWSWYPNRVLDTHYVTNLVYILLTTIGLSFCLNSRESIWHIVSIYILGSLIQLTIVELMTIATGSTGYRFGGALKVNPNSLGVQYAFAIIGAIAAIREGKYRNRKMQAGILVALLVIGIVQTDCRKAIIMTLFAIALYTIHDRRKTIDIRRVFVFFLLFCLLVILIRKVPELNDRLWHRMSGIFTGLLSDGTLDLSSAERAYFRKTAMQLFSNSPFWGIGFDGFEGYMKEIGYHHIAYSHCNYTELLSGLGLVGLIAYYYMYYQIMIHGRNCMEQDKNKRLSIDICILALMIAEFGLVSYTSTNTYIILIVLYASSRMLESNRA